MKIFMTGASGYLGKNLCQHILNRGLSKKIICLRRVGSDFSWTKHSAFNKCITTVNYHQLSANYFKTNQITHVIHCATDYGRDHASSKAKIWDINTRIPSEILKWCVESNVHMFINTDTVLHQTLNEYTMSKGAFRQHMESYSGQIQLINMQLEHFYGPGDRGNKFLTWFIRELLKRPKQIELTEGKQLRNFVHIDDVVSAYQYTLNSPETNHVQTFHVCSDETWTLQDVLEYIKLKLGIQETKLAFGARPLRPNELMQSDKDNLALKALGWSPTVTLKDGLNQLVRTELEEFKSNE